jgi:hypothetical protein
MKARHTLDLHSEDAGIFFHIHVGKRSLFLSAMRKIAVFYNLAKKQHVYGYAFLFKIRAELISFLDAMDKDIKRFSRTIKSQHGTLSQVKYPVYKSVVLTFGSPLAYRLIEALEKFDRLVCLLVLAKNAEVFIKQRAFFRVKDKYKHGFFKILTNIIHMPSRDLPESTIDDYIDNNKTYLNAKTLLGAIDPQMLYDAIHLAATPPLTARQLNKISHQLQEMTTKRVGKTKKPKRAKNDNSTKKAKKPRLGKIHE